jgi:hypothetical protein
MPQGLRAPIDWGQSIYQQASQCRAIVPNSSARCASGGVLWFSAVCPTGHGASVLRSIGDNRSTNKPPSVELFSPIAPPDAPAAASYGFRLFDGRSLRSPAASGLVYHASRFLLDKGFRFSNPQCLHRSHPRAPIFKNPLAIDFHPAGDLPCQPSEIFSYPHSWQS